ncbi:TPA: hypothetical protein ACVOYM_005175 [Vibrio diabolicus]|uniref:hypothetical protein n=1 Tax=Vibrio harveyi group TaxID=717610 RepID=UPI00215BB319|nr:MULTISPECIES: hypothetical protein [Vibrio harveyi group]EGR2324781.1 hypothetical protein [Vibrio alginolyticus]MCR9474333.1 hypothetical protein [Vibrio diabolicus]HCG9115554.1 hypothetical protein [Vibrio parahaemolyticus]
MKRYKVFNFDFDGRAEILNQEISDSWEQDVRVNWLENKQKVKEGLISEFGSINCFQKIQDFSDLGSDQPSLIAFHNKFMKQVSYSYSLGSYYPALTGACSLGERILNHLVLKLRGYFKDTPEYQKVYRKKSFDNWDLAINTLEAWDVLLPEAAEKFRELKTIRNKSIHFNPEVDENYKESALQAILKLKQIIRTQFSGFGSQPWYIDGTKGACFVRKSFEDNPFVVEVVLPNCYKVGHLHKLESARGGWKIIDEHEYANVEVSDEHFKELINNPTKYDAANNLIELGT